MIAAILSETQELVSVHMPQGAWYDFYSGNKYLSPSDRNILTLKTKLHQIPVFQRGGTAIIVYDSTTGMQTAEKVTQTANFRLNICLDCTSSPRDAVLQSCTAKSSMPWLLTIADLETVPEVTVSVGTDLTSGNINITVLGDVTTLGGKTVSQVYI